ncbi:DUF4388 domain-containing protein [Nodosilinea sp. LEGE 07298]|uniref:DUF4388 domain-containing protein n=1 Tax=Nodosilinea sp. LEGE 07298 TaxID=2777970 RepID=UPI0018824D0E|nr:DUF4388 domain-containing protein [Nodosilinea sp. LEGE 07298]MBE9109584.1 DUF4388 domain-containing protein [Nodosilinea sp. LEGE 07298]
MVVSGRLSNFSLPEVLQLVEEGSKNGLLTVRPLPNAADFSQHHFIWLKKGRIVAAANRNDHHGLAHLIARRQFLSEAQLLQLIQQCPSHMPFGIYLKSQELLTKEQLQGLFSTQVIQEICVLFELSDGTFHFASDVQMPYLEMVGVSIPATEVTLPGLRSLRNWSALKDKLPQLNSGLLSTTNEKPRTRLTRQEWGVWNFASGKTPLTEIAQRLKLPIETVRHTAFRLLVTGLVEEIPVANSIPTKSKESFQPRSAAPKVPSSNFLTQMISFLEKQC